MRVPLAPCYHHVREVRVDASLLRYEECNLVRHPEWDFTFGWDRSRQQNESRAVPDAQSLAFACGHAQLQRTGNGADYLLIQQRHIIREEHSSIRLCKKSAPFPALAGCECGVQIQTAKKPIIGNARGNLNERRIGIDMMLHEPCEAPHQLGLAGADRPGKDCAAQRGINQRAEKRTPCNAVAYEGGKREVIWCLV